jgi:hypothetical protein
VNARKGEAESMNSSWSLNQIKLFMFNVPPRAVDASPTARRYEVGSMIVGRRVTM